MFTVAGVLLYGNSSVQTTRNLSSQFVHRNLHYKNQAYFVNEFCVGRRRARSLRLNYAAQHLAVLLCCVVYVVLFSQHPRADKRVHTRRFVGPETYKWPSHNSVIDKTLHTSQPASNAEITFTFAHARTRAQYE